jgi:MFS family permease
MGDGGRLLFLPVRSAVSSRCHDAVAIGGFRGLHTGSGFDRWPFYYGYSPFSLVAEAAMDRLGPRRVIPIGAVIAGLGALLFAIGSSQLGGIGRFLQGEGGAFSPVGAFYLASKYFPPSQAATLIGATQMFGMAGGAVGQFGVGPLIANGLSWGAFWICLGFAGLAIGVVLFFPLPKEEQTKKKWGG